MSRPSLEPDAPTTVALIGCGPSGMFFLHALATRRRELELSGDVKGLAQLPLVTCYEASDAPGGIWRSKFEENVVSMYEGLWSNVPKELIEFGDYTFKEHFDGREVPAYLPRSDVLEYMLRRTISVDKDLYCTPDRYNDSDKGSRQGTRRRQHIVKFNTSVRNVTYNASTKKFGVEWLPKRYTINKNDRNLDSDSSSGSEDENDAEMKLVVAKDQFDYCIWAAGRHAKRRIPTSLVRLLRGGDSSGGVTLEEDSALNTTPFAGAILHSSLMSNFDVSVRNKRVVLIGDSSSAEDIALQALKHDAKMVHILSRNGFGDCVGTGSWPGDINPKNGKMQSKVKVHIAMPYQVVHNGTGLKCAEMEWNEEEEEYQIDNEIPPIVLQDIDTVVFCTGYTSNQDCLSPDLQCPYDDDELCWAVPEDFKMRSNALTLEFGDIEPSEELDLSGTVIPGVYNNALVSNRRMMFLMDLVSEFPLMELDVGAWQCLANITGDVNLPSKEEMGRLIEKDMVKEMHIPYIRWYMDMNYFDKVNDLPSSHWSDEWDDPRARELIFHYAKHLVCVLAQKMRNASYPVNLGVDRDLNELGEKYFRIVLHSFHARYGLNPKAADAEWRTFWDADPTLFHSIYTNQVAAPLPGHWLELDKHGKLTSFFEPIQTKKQISASCQDHADFLDMSGGTLPVNGVPKTVALIGCGMSGMSFLHALAIRSRELERSGDKEGLLRLPLVTCFEASDEPGGLWRSLSKQDEKEHSSNMYEGMWSNTAWPLFEYSDYTFQEHFGGQKVPAYLPREDVLSYIIERTKKADPGLFQAACERNKHQTNNYDFADEKKNHKDDGENVSRHYSIKFNTSVRRVFYNSATRKFEVFYAASISGKPDQRDNVVTMEQYDYCIWAAGKHGKPRIPRPLLKLLKRGGTAAYYDGPSDGEDEREHVPFKGTILHSSHMSDFSSAVSEKRIVLIGDSGSAEDLALEAVKQNAEIVYILSRSGYGDCAYTGSWPCDVNPETGRMEPKVKIHLGLPFRIVQNGTGLKCSQMYWDEKEEIFETDSHETQFLLERIDTVIFCTGYVPNQGCLATELRFPHNKSTHWIAPTDFKMRPNPLISELGDIKPSQELRVSGNIIPGVYENFLISNPCMMFLADFNPESSLLEVDVAAWLCLAHITGQVQLPSREKMEKCITEKMLEEMHIVYIRWFTDMNYFYALNDLPSDHWSGNWKDPRAKELNEQYFRYFIGALAQKMRNANYPVNFGAPGALNELGEKYVQVKMSDENARHALDPDLIDAAWCTFRDADPGNFNSLYTGEAAGPLPCRWMDLDKDGKLTSFSV